MAERGTFILHFLRSSLLARPYSASLCNLAQPPTTTTFVLLILSSHFTAIAIALPGVGFQSNPRDPCGKVWLFNFLPRGSVSSRLPPFSFYIFQSFSLPLFSPTSFPLCRHSCREAVHFSSRGTIVLFELYTLSVAR